MSDTLAFAQYVTLRTENGNGNYNFQNYWVNEDAQFTSTEMGTNYTYGFMPFIFNGITVTKAGDNQPAALTFPNNELSRGWAETAIANNWVAYVHTVLVNPDNKTDTQLITKYVGQIVAGRWDASSLQLEMASVLDAVGNDVPRKRLTKQLVGSLPLTSNVRVA